MQPLTLICIVLLAAVLWIAFVCGMLTHLARSERRAGLRLPRQRASDIAPPQWTRNRRRVKVRRRRTSRRVPTHPPIR